MMKLLALVAVLAVCVGERKFSGRHGIIEELRRAPRGLGWALFFGGWGRGEMATTVNDFRVSAVGVADSTMECREELSE